MTVAVHTAAAGSGEITAVWPGFVDTAYGVAVDVGSTTIAGHLCDLATGEVLASAGLMNPQIRFGEDLMSRVSYVMMNPGGERAAHRPRCAPQSTTSMQELTDAAARRPWRWCSTSWSSATRSCTTSCSASTRRRSARRRSRSPRTCRSTRGPRTSAVAARVPACTCCPCIAGHVGADTAAAILAEGPHRGDEVQLLVDVGTNAEIVLGNREGLFAASSPTGPAFEGAQISCGQRATAGAIERVRIDRDTLEPRFKVIGSDRWSDEPGFVESLPAGGVTGVCGSGIIEVIAELFLAGVIDADGTIDGVAGRRAPLASCPDDRIFAYVLHPAPGEAEPSSPGTSSCASPRTTCAPSSSPRPRCSAGVRLLMDHAGLDRSRRSTRSAWPVRSAATSTRSTRWCSA